MAARQAPQKPKAALVMLVAVALAATGIAHGLPGLIALPVGMFVASITYPAVAATGRKDYQGNPTPANPSEAAQIGRWRYWSSMRTAMFAGLNPGWPVRLSWFGTVLAAVVAYLLLPIDPSVASGQFEALSPVLAYGRQLNALGAALALSGLDHAGRARGEVPSPGVTHKAVVDRIKAGWLPPAIAAVIGSGLGLALAAVAVVLRPVWSALAPLVEVSDATLFVLAGVGGLLAGLYLLVRGEALAHHRRLVEGTVQWRPRWQMLKEDPAPRLVNRVEMDSGPVVDTFEADGSKGAALYIQMTLKIAPTMGSGLSCMVLDVPDTGTDGQPIEGSRSDTRFDIVSVPAGWSPDVTDPATSEEDVALAARIALATACDTGGLAPRYVFTGVTRLTAAPKTRSAPKRRMVDTAVEGQVLAWNEDPTTVGRQDESETPTEDAPQAWALNWSHADGAGANEFRTRCAGIFAGIVQAHTLVDHRANNHDGLCVFGALDAVAWENDLGVDDTWVYQTSEEDTWNGRWSSALSKIGPNAPVPQFNVESEGKLANGTVVRHLAFMNRQGMTVEQLFEAEKALPTVLEAAPFVSMTGWDGGTGRPGDRHAMAVTLNWSSSPVPTRPDDLKPVAGSDAPRWVLAGLLNSAFRDARLPRPELAGAEPMTSASSRTQIWKMRVRLYGGAFSTVRNAIHAIRQSWGSEWVRIEDATDGCVIVAGGSPSGRSVRLANPRRDKKYLSSLDWAQVFNDSGLAGIDGRLPELVSVGSLEHNPQVEVLEFNLEGTGLSFSRFREVRTKLEANADKAYVEPRSVKNAPSKVVLYASKEHPMPEMSPYRWDTIDASTGYPFATNVEGEPVVFSPKEDIHLMVVGGSGSGKSVILQSLMTGALRRGHELYLGDPTKGAADFLFAEPYAKAVTRDLMSTLGMMRGLYEEVRRRVVVNSAAGVANYRHLPEDQRPNHILLVLDEFVSMITPDKVSRTPSDDPAVELERENALAENAAKAEIGAITGKISREARSAGVTMLLATQKLTARDLDSIPGGGSLKVNLSRLIAGKSTQGERMSALKDFSRAPELGEHVPPGRGIFEPVTGSPTLVQTWYDPREQQALAEYVARHRAPLTEDQKLDVAAFTPKMADPEEDFGEAPDLFGDEPEVVEVGTLQITLDDLELTLDDLEEVTPEAGQPDGADEFRAAVSARLAEAGGGIAVLGTGLGFGTVELADYAQDGDVGWWPATAVQRWLDEDPEHRHRRIVLADAALGEEDPVFGIEFRDLASDALEGTDHVLLSPDRDWEQDLRDWLAEAPAPVADPEAEVEDDHDPEPVVIFPDIDEDDESSPAAPAASPVVEDDFFSDDVAVPDRLARARALKERVLRGESL